MEKTKALAVGLVVIMTISIISSGVIGVVGAVGKSNDNGQMMSLSDAGLSESWSQSGNYITANAIMVDDTRNQVILMSDSAVQAVDPSTGDVIWTTTGLNIAPWEDSGKGFASDPDTGYLILSSYYNLKYIDPSDGSVTTIDTNNDNVDYMTYAIIEDPSNKGDFYVSGNTKHYRVNISTGQTNTAVDSVDGGVARSLGLYENNNIIAVTTISGNDDVPGIFSSGFGFTGLWYNTEGATKMRTITINDVAYVSGYKNDNQYTWLIKGDGNLVKRLDGFFPITTRSHAAGLGYNAQLSNITAYDKNYNKQWKFDHGVNITAIGASDASGSLYIYDTGGGLTKYTPGPVTENTLSGQVYDEAGDPIDNAAVEAWINDTSFEGATTNSSGYYEITDLESGTYDVKTTASGYDEKWKNDLTIDSNTTLDFTLETTYTVSGTVTDGDGNPLPNATVERWRGTTTPNSSGYYEFTNVGYGDYVYEAILEGYENVAKSRTIDSDTTIDFILIKNNLPKISSTTPDDGGTVNSQPPIQLSAEVYDPEGDTYDYEIRYYKDGTWVTKTSGTISYSGTSTITASIENPPSGQNRWSIWLSDGATKSKTANLTFDYRADPPYVSDASPTGGDYYRYRSVNPYAIIEDANGDNVNASLVKINKDGSTTVLETITNQTTPATISTQYTADRGENRWYVSMTDGAHDVNSSVFEYRTPHSINVFGSYSGVLDLLDDRQVNATITSTESPYYDERSTTNGIVDLEGVPEETFIVTLNANNFSKASIVVDDPASQQYAVLYPDEANDGGNDFYDQHFDLDDRSGNFPPEDAWVSAYVNVDGEYQEAGSSYFGVGNDAMLRLEDGVSYQLRVHNFNNDVRTLGLFSGDESQYGNESVTLVITDTGGGDDPPEEENDPPVAAFDTPTQMLTNTTYTFDASPSEDPDGNIVDYRWDFTHNGTVDETGVQASWNYTTAGEYTITLTVEDDDGANSTVYQTVVVATGETGNEYPQARFSWSPLNPNASESISFDASNSTDPDGSIASYEWDWTDDGTFEGSGATPTHNYSTNGTYNVTLKVTDGEGATATLTQSVVVGGTNVSLYPRAKFDWSPAIAAPNETVTFDASESYDPDGNITAYEWDLNESGTYDVTGEVVTRIFDSEGTYNVSLRVVNENNLTAVLNQTVRVDANRTNKQPVAIVNYNPQNPDPGATVTFNASESYDIEAAIETYKWDLNNDGVFEADGVTAIRSFNDEGTYTVQLMVIDERGASNVTTAEIKVGAGGDAPKPDWTWDAELVTYDDGNGSIRVSINTDDTTTLSNVVVEIYERGNPDNDFPNASLGSVNSVVHTQALNENQTEKEWVVEIHVTEPDGERVTDQKIISPAHQTTPPQLPGWVRAGFAFIALMLTAGLFSRVNFGAGAVVVALEGGILWWAGWLGGLTTGAAVGFALFIAVLGYLSQQQRGVPT